MEAVAAPTLKQPREAEQVGPGRWGTVRAGATLGRENARLGRWLVAPAVAITAALVIYPLVIGVQTSLHAPAPTLNAPSKFVGFGNYSDVLNDPTTRSTF